MAGRHSPLAVPLLALLLGPACSPQSERLDRAQDVAAEASKETSSLPDLAELDTESWVRIFHPERASSGYNLVLWGARVPLLIDMNGRVVHSWPRARVKSRVRLLADGSLLGIALGRGVVEYDWDGNLTWEYSREDLLPHHDLRRRANGNTLVVVKVSRSVADDVLEIDRSGEVVWEWRAAEHLADYIGESPVHPRDITHINSVQELPSNRLFRQGDERFRPGNLLISARNLNAVFVIDKQTKEVVWTYDHQLDLQHEALMVPRGMPGSGRIQLFNNGYRNWYKYRRSTLLEIEPGDGSIRWRFESDGFYSPTGGVQQPLPNGNILVGSTRGGRIFEITRAGEIVWQWAPGFDPVRPSRYAYDHTPQLVALGAPLEIPVEPPPDYRHLDRNVHRFAAGGGLRRVVIDGRPRFLLADNNQCHRVLPPAHTTLELRYGLDRRKLQRLGRLDYTVRFAVRVSVEGSDEGLSFEETVGIERPWRGRLFRLDPYAYRWLEICIETSGLGAAPGEATEDLALWENPLIRPVASVDEEVPTAVEPLAPDELTAEELAARREHLETLGYVN